MRGFVLLTTTLLTLSSADYPFRNVSLPWQQRVDDLVSRLTLDEVVSQTMSLYGKPTPGIPRLGINPYNYISECLSGQRRTNVTSYPQPIGLAATFSPELVETMAGFISTEMRAIWNNDRQKGAGYKNNHGLTCFSPVINILRHPLWGRNQETFGEDPGLTSLMGAAYVRGLQGSHPRFIRAGAGCKHFDVHGGPENIPVSRFSFNAQVSTRDWQMTFLPAFKACVEAGSYSIMCSYNRINGVPACANKKLLTDITREEWGFHGYVVSDAGAIINIRTFHHYCHNKTCVAGAALTAGCNLELASDYFKSAKPAIKEGLLTEATVRQRVKPLFYTRLRLGEFDPPDTNPYSKLGMSEIQKASHRDLSITAAAKSFVLLKNLNNALPIQKKLNKISVVGPFASTNLEKIYGAYASLVVGEYARTPFEGLSSLASSASTVSGCKDPACEQYNQTDISGAVQGADLVVVCLGTGTDLEREAHDRSDISLPGRQLDLLMDAVAYAKGSPVVLLLFNAGPLDITWAKWSPDVSAILACFFPAQPTGDALYRVFTGTGDGGVPAARLPMTWPAYLQQVPPITNYDMSGHTYRYYEGEPLYPFGYGLSYSRFFYSNLKVPASVVEGQDLNVSVRVRNIGGRSAEEVVQAYIKWNDASLPAPKLHLVGFKRVHVPASQNHVVSFSVTARQRSLWMDDNTGFAEMTGEMAIYIGGQQPNQITQVDSNILSSTFQITKTTINHSTDKSLRYKPRDPYVEPEFYFD